MIERLPRSHDAVLGYRVVGDVSAGDYEQLVPAAQSVVDEHGSLSLLLDLTEFRWEKVQAWGADLRFGEHFRDSIARMAIVGDHAWERLLARLAQPFYAREARYFTDRDAAWAWLES